MIRPPAVRSRHAPAALTILMMGVFAVLVALVPFGCASKRQAVEVPPLLGEAPSPEVSAAAPGPKDSPDTKFPDAPTLDAPAVPPSGKEDGGGPVTQETAPAGAPVQGRSEATPPEVKTPKAPAAPAPPATPRGKSTVTPGPGKQAATPTLDLKSLEKRLRDTRAIGVFTKLSLKNQVDDLLEEFREFHQSRDQALLAKLRQAYDLLLLKVLSLLQDNDPMLARDISSSREALWKILTDPDGFKNL